MYLNVFLNVSNIFACKFECLQNVTWSLFKHSAARTPERLECDKLKWLNKYWCWKISSAFYGIPRKANVTFYSVKLNFTRNDSIYSHSTWNTKLFDRSNSHTGKPNLIEYTITPTQPAHQRLDWKAYKALSCTSNSVRYSVVSERAPRKVA